MASSSKPSYEAYLSMYAKKQGQLERKGLSMYDNTPLSEIEFYTMYKAEKNFRKDLVRSGQLKSIGNITRQLVRDQTYEYSEKTIRARYEYTKQTNQNIMLQDIREGIAKIDWSVLSKEYHELKVRYKRDLNLSDKDLVDRVKYDISHKFFASYYI